MCIDDNLKCVQFIVTEEQFSPQTLSNIVMTSLICVYHCMH